MTRVGTVERLWRYPVKSMIGEELQAAAVGSRGVAGDRARAVVDAEGRVASAKQSKRWPGLFTTRAAYLREPTDAEPAPAVRLTLPDGTSATSDDAALPVLLARQFGRAVRLTDTPPGGARSAEDLDDGTEETFELHRGTFFDDAVFHLVTTASLARLAGAYPSGDFAAERFRPNVLVATPDGDGGFVEDAWIGHRLRLGDEVEVQVIGSCRRCVMVSLEQEGRGRDPLILRTAAQANGACIGVYATIVRGGRVPRGAPTTLLEDST